MTDIAGRLAGHYLARDLKHEPANILYPVSLANRLKAELEPLGVEVTIIDQAQMEKEGWGSLLGVGQGSVRDSAVVVMHWKGASGGEHDDPVCFVGKGVCFDTGGISIKPAGGMEDMKWDMGGAAAVSGLMKTLATRKAKANVVGLVGLVENMPDANAQRPGDIVTSLSGQTIQVLNTDAEGRLVLADVLWHAQEKYKPRFIVDLATLTGAMLVALGHEKAGVFSNDDELANQLFDASEATGEYVWRMPLGQEYNKMLDSKEADMRNIGGGRWGGSITAACFLERFIQKGQKWAHMDIAGVVWTDKPKPMVGVGATGFAVRSLDKLVQDNYEA
jgi:leucyl aminopeptidase